jgi:protein-S-isoprenylcysteine O-methyltransferase Ste14
MKRLGAVLGSALFLVVAPGTIAVYVPWLMSRWHVAPALLGFPPFRWVGIALIVGGLPVLLDSFARFALRGLGTPAPIAPPKHLVVTGWYRYVRNPMYVALVAMIIGQGLLFGRTSVLEWGLVFWALTHLFVMFYEEPHLHRVFGSEYDTYRAAVHRWLPRLRPYSASASQSA